MNLGLSELQKSEFINYKPINRPIVIYNQIPNINWIVGFSSAEGCFSVNISNITTNKKKQFVNI